MSETTTDTFSKVPAYVAAPPLRPLTRNEIKVLRLIQVRDPYRDKAPGKAGRVARLRTIEHLRALGLVRTNRWQLLTVTGRGKEIILANPTKPKKR